MFIKQIVLVIIITLLSLSGFMCSATNRDYNKFIRHIFNKYGTKGVINLEGFEHLLDNIGLGNIELSTNHSINEHFQQKDYKEPNWKEMDAGDNIEVSNESLWHEIVFKKLHGKDHNHQMRGVGSKIRVMSGGESCESHFLFVYSFK